MSDVQVSGDTAYRPANPPDDAPPPNPIATTRISNPIEGEGEESVIRESVKALNEERRKKGEAVEANRDPVRMRYLDDDPKTLKQVAKDTSDYHRLAQPDAQALMKLGVSKADTLALAKSEAFAKQYGLEPAAANEYVRTGEMPPDKIGLAVDGVEIRRLGDTESYHSDAHALKNAREAAQLQGTWREAKAQQEQAFRDQIEQAEVARQEAESRRSQEAAQQQAAQQRAAQEQAAQQQAAHEQARLAAQAQFAQLSAEEQEALKELNQIGVWAQHAHPEERAQYWQHAQARDSELRQGLQQVGQLRAAQQIQIQKAQDVEWERVGAQHDKVFERELAKRHPQAPPIIRRCKGLVRNTSKKICK